METVSKRERNINNYLKKLEANSKYIDYVNSFGEKNNLSKDDLNYLKVGYASFLLFLWKDDFIKKDSNKNLSTTLIEENLEKATSIISTKFNNKWKIDNIEFSNYLEVLDKVRNKFPNYRNNKYLVGKKGFYLKYFNRLIASVVFIVEKNKMN